VRFCISELVFHWGVFFAVPLYTIFWVRNLNASEGWIGLYRMAESATTIVVLPFWARFTARRGNRLALFISAAGMTLYTFCTPFVPSIEWIVALSVLGGAASSGFSLALFNELLRVSPEQNRIAHIAAFNTTINFAAFVSPLVSTSLIPLFGIHAVLLLAAAFRCIGVLGIWRIFSDQKRAGKPAMR
jgi:MFS family permease